MKELRTTVNYRLSADLNISQTLVTIIGNDEDAIQMGREQRTLLSAWATGWDEASREIDGDILHGDSE